MEKSYIYKITFEEVPHFYIGVRKRDPETDPYLGSPITHKNYWEIYTPKKQIFCVLEDWDRAQELEKQIIRENWTNKYCLNENCGGCFSGEVSAKNGRAIQERRKNDPELDQRLREASAKNARNAVRAREERRKNDPEFDQRLRETSAKNGRKGARATQELRENDPEFDQRCREAEAKGGRKGVRAREKRRENDPEFDQRLREASAKGARKTGAQRWRCTETGHISNPGALSNYQRKRGIDTKNRVRAD